MSMKRGTGQDLVDRYFDSTADYWREVYHHQGLQGLIYRERMETAMRWASELGLPPGAGVLDAGCGAGLMATRLAARGWQVTGTDSSPEMVDLARRQAEASGLLSSVRMVLADAHRLPFPSGEFDLVVALGLLPWLHDPPRAVAEMVRVLRTGGWMILTADNRARLNFLTEPRENALLTPLKLARRASRRTHDRQAAGPPAHLHLPSQVDRILTDAGLEVVRRATVGYGPFTFLGRPVLGDGAGLRIYGQLRKLSERRLPALRWMGWHYLVAARNSGVTSRNSGG